MKITILGIGNWGCSIAHMLCDQEHEVTLWGRNNEKVQHLRCSNLHPKMEKKLHRIPVLTSSLDEALAKAEIIFEAVTVQGLSDLVSILRRYKPQIPLVITSKGIETNSGFFPSQIIERGLRCQEISEIAVLSGPTLSAEIAKGGFACAALSCKDLYLGKKLAQLLKSKNFEMNCNTDLIGTQLGGAYKNILAIGSGILEGAQLGDNARAFFLTKGFQEMLKLGIALKCVPQTLMGYSGIGDLIVTCYSRLSRNFSYGLHLGNEKSHRDALKLVNSTTEGINTIRGALNLAKTKKCDLPISDAIMGIVEEKYKAHQIIELIK